MLRSGTWFRRGDLEEMPVGSVYVWDNKFGGFEAGIKIDELELDPRFQKHECFISDTWNGKYTYCIVEKIGE